MFESKILKAGLIGVLVLVGSACNNPSSNSDPSPTVVSVQGVVVNPQVIHFEAVGETRQVAAVIFPPNATDRVVAWESSDPTVATVDAGGQVTAKAAGVDVFITAHTHDGGYQASVNVTVTPN